MDLLSGFSQALGDCEKGFFTEWKLGNTPNEKPGNPAFGGVFFCLLKTRNGQRQNELEFSASLHLSRR